MLQLFEAEQREHRKGAQRLEAQLKTSRKKQAAQKIKQKADQKKAAAKPDPAKPKARQQQPKAKQKQKQPKHSGNTAAAEKPRSFRSAVLNLSPTPIDPALSRVYGLGPGFRPTPKPSACYQHYSRTQSDQLC